MFVCQFRVTGIGHFPVDMLRYDGCFPLNSDDAVAETDSPGVRREVCLMMVRAQKVQCKPTEGRWNSFGWSAKVERVYKYAT
jgi:hypothetical protein